VSAFSYKAYGLGIHAYCRLPELKAEATQADVTIRLALPGEQMPAIDQFPAPTSKTQRPFLRPSADEICLLWDQVACCSIRQGREIVVRPLPGAVDELLRLHLLGSAIGVLLHQRGLFPLHASAVEVDGQAILFMGQWGAGKSTMAAVMHQRGHQLLADDVAALTVRTNGIQVLPAFPQLKLWPTSIESLGALAEVLPKVHPEFDKRSLLVTPLFPQIPLPLCCIFMLEYGDLSVIQSALPTEALFALLSNWYMARFGEAFATSVERNTIFHLCANLLRQIPVLLMQRTPMLADLPQHAQLVEDYLYRIM
jgi:hypothetical protein